MLLVITLRTFIVAIAVVLAAYLHGHDNTFAALCILGATTAIAATWIAGGTPASLTFRRGARAATLGIPGFLAVFFIATGEPFGAIAAIAAGSLFWAAWIVGEMFDESE